MKYLIPGIFVLTAFVIGSGCADDVSSPRAKTTSEQERSTKSASEDFLNLLQQEQQMIESQKLMEGVLKCEGYLSSNMTENFCVSEVPETWRPFEFNNETYYVQPLSANWD